MQFCVIPQGTQDALIFDVENELEALLSAMNANDIPRLIVWVGDPDGDHYPNGQFVYARPENG